MKGFLEYSPGNTLLHQMNPLTKLLLAFFMSISCFVSGNHLYLVGIILLSLLLSVVGGIPQKGLGMLKGLLKIGVVLFLIQALIIRDGNILLRLPLYLYLTDKGIFFSSLITLRLIGATMPLGLMLSVTKMTDLSNVLVEKLGIPYRYTFVLTTALRFIPIFSNEMATIIEAQTARGVEFDTKNPLRRIGLILPLCVPLLISSVKRIEGTAISTELRGFNLRTKHSGYKKYPMKGLDYATILFTACLFALGIIL